ncbi:hypothetical protein GGTG_04534 [Gaeumannomyces tritici R3-111a-1]|uniref:Uncharacterized protein n=1 Tax=Gaeumannomyces tritici (strain R3-111a-1) TaxID=644352 RepID=J3NTD5_GAET3|nr:hypothetical protein GGTG_04534 [Gaeumannomyces tritici R3-111a-1]EJT79450.1 hypothetical protein GGTG_04534 [Gaeumannomyces tritici R3-111a-1]
MPSVKNPNKPPKNRIAARPVKERKTQQKKSAEGKLSRVEKSTARREARPGLLPTGGRKLDRKMNHALKRQMEADGEVEMKDVREKKSSASKTKEASDPKASDDMELDIS